MTLTIKGLNGKITALKLNLKRNKSKGAGTLSANVGTSNIITKTISVSDITNSYEEYTFNASTPIESTEDVVITLSATENSLYCNSFTIVYDKTSTEPSKTTTSLSFGEDYDGKIIIKYIGDETLYSIPATLTPAIDGAKITYKSSDPDLVYIDENNGDILVAGTEPGSATITASYAGDDTYAPSSASYTIQVKKPVAVEDGVFDFTSGELDYGSGKTPTLGSTEDDYFYSSTWTNNKIIMTTSGKVRWFNSQGTNDLRFYDKNGLATFTISSLEGYHITSITLTGDAFNCLSAYGEYANKKWEGNAKEVSFQPNKKGNGIETITVTYEPDVTLATAVSSFSTYAADYAVDYSKAGLEAYAITLDEANSKVSYTAINGTVKENTPVLVKGEASTTYSLAPSTETATDVTTALQISDGSVKAANNLYYGFATIGGVSGFKLVDNGVTIPAKKGYLKLSSASNAKTFYAFDGDVTGIEETFSKADSEKAFAPMYNISGQRVGEGYKGIVIVNGKKYMK